MKIKLQMAIACEFSIAMTAILIEITEKKEAILEFGGGCNGCAQVDVTLKDGIEKQMLEQFSGELTAIKDATEHKAGQHSYY